MSDALIEQEEDRGLRRIQDGKCYHCGVLVFWRSDDRRASRDGSFVDLDGGIECPDGKLHQG